MAQKAADPYDKSWVIKRQLDEPWRFELPARDEPGHVPWYKDVGPRPLMITRTTEKDGRHRTVWFNVAVMEEGESMTTLLHEKLSVSGDFETVAVEFIPVETSDFPDITFLQHALPQESDVNYRPGPPDLRRWVYSSSQGIYLPGPQ